MAPATAFLPYCKMAPPHRREASVSMPTRCFSQFALTSPGLSWAEKAREAGAGCRATAGPGGITRRHAVAHPSLPRTLASPGRRLPPSLPARRPGRLPLKAGGEGLRAPLPVRPASPGLGQPPGLPTRRLAEHHVCFPHGPRQPGAEEAGNPVPSAAAARAQQGPPQHPFSSLSQVGLR